MFDQPSSMFEANFWKKVTRYFSHFRKLASDTACRCSTVHNSGSCLYVYDNERKRDAAKSVTGQRQKKDRKEKVPIRCRVSASQAARLQRQTWSDKVPLFTSRQDQAVPAAVKKKRTNTHTHWPPASTPESKQHIALGCMQIQIHPQHRKSPAYTDWRVCHTWYTAHSPHPKCAISIWLTSVNRWCFVFLVNKPQSGMHNKPSNVICYELSGWNVSIGTR